MHFSISTLIYTLPAVLVALTVHEFAHGYVSSRMGDPTPRMEGRLSLNPLAHLDVIGTLCLLLVGFGWAKPVSVNPYYYRDPKKGMAVVALAGPMTNFVTAFVALFVYGLCVYFMPERFWQVPAVLYLINLLEYVALIDIGLGVFNLIPIPPLDGSKVLGAFLPEDLYMNLMRYEAYGQLLLLALLYFDFLNAPLYHLRNGVLEGMIFLINLFLGLF
ncbi:MAG: site-2 protease family protein [Eubacteriales bacterium]|jgi:Zn-dependent protease